MYTQGFKFKKKKSEKFDENFPKKRKEKLFKYTLIEQKNREIFLTKNRDFFFLV